MLAALGLDSLEALVEETVPASIRLRKPLSLPAPLAEDELLAGARDLAGRNEV